MTMRVGFVCQWFPPEPVTIPPGIAAALTRRGADVEVLTGIPNYPSGEVVAGYHAWAVMTEECSGFKVHRTPLYPSHDSGSISRFMNYGSWALSSALLGARHLRTKDVTLVYSSPATSALPALVAERVFRVPYVLLIQDMWPDSVAASGMLSPRLAGVVSSALSLFMKLTYRRAARIVVISPGMADVLVSRGVPSGKIDLVYNWVEPSSEPEGSDRATWRERLGIAEQDFILMYAGNHGAAQALNFVIDGAADLADAGIHLVMVGSGIEKPALAERATRAGLVNVHFVGPVPASEMTRLMAVADAQLVSLADQPLFSITTPSKLQAILSVGQPIVAAARGDVAEVVKSAAAGIVVEPGDPRSFAAAVKEFARLPREERVEMGRRGRHYYDQHMDERVGGERLFCVLQSVARRGAARTKSAGVAR